VEKLLDRIVTIIFVIALIAIFYFVAQYVSQRMVNGETDDIEIAVDEDDFFVDSEDIDDTNSDDEEYYNEEGIADSDVPEEYNDEIASIMKDVTGETAKPETPSKPSKSESEPEEEESSSSTTTTVENQARYMIVAGSFTSKPNAEVHMKTLEKEGYSPEIVNFNGSKMFTVVASRYNNRASADAAIKQLKGKKIECYVHTKRLN